jgi:hypothetical protein
MSATSNVTSVQLASVKGIRATTEGTFAYHQISKSKQKSTLSQLNHTMGRHGVAGVNLALHSVRIMMLSRVSDGGSCQGNSSNSQTFDETDHGEFRVKEVKTVELQL